MARATYYLGLFLAGCVATSLVGTVATLHPAFFRAVLLIGIVLGLVWVLAWVLDDWIIDHFGINRLTYYSVLILAFVVCLIGVGGVLWMQW